MKTHTKTDDKWTAENAIPVLDLGGKIKAIWVSASGSARVRVPERVLIMSMIGTVKNAAFAAMSEKRAWAGSYATSANFNFTYIDPETEQETTMGKTDTETKTDFDLSKLDEIVFKHGSHEEPTKGMCFMEAAAYVAGESHTDHPKCVCPVLGAAARSLNDATHWKDDEQRTRVLKPFLVKLLGTAEASTVKVKVARAKAAAAAARKFADEFDPSLEPHVRLEKNATYLMEQLIAAQ